jgi:phosphoserine / homoserine phosphotransferase
VTNRQQARPSRPPILTTDLEGVLVPEIWIAVAERTGIDALRRTTRDEPDYDLLMGQRLAILREHGLSLPDIQAVIATMEPLPGAAEFLEWARARLSCIVVSDTFYEFAMPLMQQLGYPTLFCNSLEAGADGTVTGYRLRQPDGKREVVRALQGLGFRLLAVGDSYNDTGMLTTADSGVFFSAPPAIAAEFPQLPALHTYDQLKDAIDRFLAGQ